MGVSLAPDSNGQERTSPDNRAFFMRRDAVFPTLPDFARRPNRLVKFGTHNLTASPPSLKVIRIGLKSNWLKPARGYPKSPPGTGHVTPALRDAT